MKWACGGLEVGMRWMLRDRYVKWACNQGGQSNLRKRLKEAGLTVAKDDPALGRILEVIKQREALGYSYDTAQASFELLARKELGQLPRFFEVKRYRVSVERRKNKYNEMVSLSEAVVVVKVGDEKKLSVSESLDETGPDRGPVNALAKALAKDLGDYQSMIDDVRLVDFKVRITQGYFHEPRIQKITVYPGSKETLLFLICLKKIC